MGDKCIFNALRRIAEISTGAHVQAVASLGSLSRLKVTLRVEPLLLKILKRLFFFLLD